MGTRAYMSPERFDPEGWDGDNADGYSGDVWSLGVVVLECLVGHYPLIGSGEKPDWAALVCAICSGKRLELPANASPELQSFLQRCLEKEWNKRGTVDELLDHPFVNKSCCDQGLPGLDLQA
ncbi:mitogen activated protein kinase kinase, putative [Ricinus communis]|uniref:Mitogen activated protein kinase kinase, putative n=2 Tax=Ricinus communis TaxID=3988 RepID=B9T5L0_RICCO|nr:mitogen activated protein kinase kinase, putative [Ricinus communis]